MYAIENEIFQTVDFIFFHNKRGDFHVKNCKEGFVPAVWLKGKGAMVHLVHSQPWTMWTQDTVLSKSVILLHVLLFSVFPKYINILFHSQHSQ